MLQALKDLEGKSKDLFEALTLQFAKNTKLQAGTAMNISGNVIVKPKIESDPTDGASFMKVPCDKKSSDAASITIKAEGAGISVQDAAKAPVKADKADKAEASTPAAKTAAEKATKDATEKSTAADKAKADATDAKKEADEKKTKDVEDKKAKETKEAEDKKTKETKEAEDKKTKETKEAEDKKKKEAAAKKWISMSKWGYIIPMKWKTSWMRTHYDRFLVS